MQRNSCNATRDALCALLASPPPAPRLRRAPCPIVTESCNPWYPFLLPPRTTAAGNISPDITSNKSLAGARPSRRIDGNQSSEADAERSRGGKPRQRSGRRPQDRKRPAGARRILLCISVHPTPREPLWCNGSSTCLCRTLSENRPVSVTPCRLRHISGSAGHRRAPLRCRYSSTSFGQSLQPPTRSPVLLSRCGHHGTRAFMSHFRPLSTETPCADPPIHQSCLCSREGVAGGQTIHEAQSEVVAADHGR